jgi:ankyrin repeat protein
MNSEDAAFIDAGEPVAVAAVRAIRAGDVAALEELLRERPGLARARLKRNGVGRTLLHIVTDWPGHFPNGAASVAALVAAGADVNAPVTGPHAEMPLHWAASSDDVEVLDALLDAGADIEAPGAVIAGGSPLRDATAFGQWSAARRLVERGAQTTSFDAAALGLTDRLRADFAQTRPAQKALDEAFWAACHGGQRQTAEFLLAQGAELDFVPEWEDLTPLDAAARSGATDVLTWLHAHGARPAAELRQDD